MTATGGDPVPDEDRPQTGVGVPDDWERLWTPHRMSYIQGEGKPAGDDDDACPFCRIPSMSDAEGHIVHRGELLYAVLNLYPYNAGHLLLVPYRHIADVTELTDAESTELSAMTKRALTAIRAASGAQGFNVGINLGSVAGAGIAAHLHQHLVPRWRGDANFMPVVGRTKVLSQLLDGTRELFVRHWPRD